MTFLILERMKPTMGKNTNFTFSSSSLLFDFLHMFLVFFRQQKHILSSPRHLRTLNYSERRPFAAGVQYYTND